MEGLTRLVTESLARHGFDRPLDYRRLHWSSWFRCESPHSLLSVPSKPGVFALAEEIMDFAHTPNRVVTGASPVPPARSAAAPDTDAESGVEERRFSAASSAPTETVASAAVGIAHAGHRVEPRRHMLAVTQFFDADDMAFTLDRMLTRANPMRARLTSGHYFIRFVIIEDESQRRYISTALNQWIANAGEKASGIGSHFASSLEITDAHVGRAPLPANAGAATCRLGASAAPVQAERSSAALRDLPAASPISAVAPHLDSGAAANIHCPSPLPSGF
jgi:hypothetical protein